jgi:hypothetical protein
MGHRYTFMSILKSLMNQGFWKRAAIYRGTRQSPKDARLQLLQFYISILYTLLTGWAIASQVLLGEYEGVIAGGADGARL